MLRSISAPGIDKALGRIADVRPERDPRRKRRYMRRSPRGLSGNHRIQAGIYF
jgi:hypothetical protein